MSTCSRMWPVAAGSTCGWRQLSATQSAWNRSVHFLVISARGRLSCRACPIVRSSAVERHTVGVEQIRPFPGDFGQGAALLPGLSDRAVVHVRQVAHVLHLPGELKLEKAAEDIVDDEGAEIAYVGGRIDRRAAVVEAEYAIGLRRPEFAGFPRERVEKLHGHGWVKGDVGLLSHIHPKRNAVFWPTACRWRAAVQNLVATRRMACFNG